MNLKNLILLFAALITFGEAKSQTTTPGPVEKQITDSICNCMAKIDMSKVTTREQANAAFMECFTKKSDLIVAVAEERGADMTDHAAMRQIGIDIGKDLLKMNCANFMKLSVVMAQDKVQQENAHATQGKLLRIDNKGFNYLVIVDDNKKEHSFLWLHQFSGSEKFVNGLGTSAGKKVSITWQDTEVYLPSAKGYYNVKEITGLNIF